MSIWKHGDNGYQEYYESGKFGKASYMVVFRNHGQKEWFAAVGNSGGGVETLIDKNATAVMQEKRSGCFGGGVCPLSSTDPDSMRRACELAHETSICAINSAALTALSEPRGDAA